MGAFIEGGRSPAASIQGPLRGCWATCPSHWDRDQAGRMWGLGSGQRLQLPRPRRLPQAWLTTGASPLVGFVREEAVSLSPSRPSASPETLLLFLP